MDNPYIHDCFSCINYTCDREFFYFAESKLAKKVGAKIIMSRSAYHVIKNMHPIF